jgi:hypothetical protein
MMEIARSGATGPVVSGEYDMVEWSSLAHFKACQIDVYNFLLLTSMQRRDEGAQCCRLISPAAVVVQAQGRTSLLTAEGELVILTDCHPG